ncbi:MAG TPA: VWA domain-containing protein [Candidatus Acidoferrum sp.]
MPHASPLTRTSFTIAALLLAFCTYALLAPAQTLSPGEVRLSSHPYEPRPIFRSVSRLVQLEVVVRDSPGRAVAGLTKDNFAVFDGSTERDLTAFSVETFNAPADAPKSASPAPDTPANRTALTLAPKLPSQNPVSARWIGLLFDDINTAPGDLAHTKIAAARFIKEAVGSDDRIAVFTTSSGMASGFTNDSAAILLVMTKLQSHPRVSPGGLARCPRMTAYEAYQIIKGDPSAMKAKVLEACTCGGSSGCDALEAIPDNNFMNLTPTNPNAGYSLPTYVLDPILAQAQQTWDQARVASQVTFDAIKSSLDQLARMPGKRMLLLASSGFLSNTLDQEQDSIINEALRAGVVINSLDAKGLYAEAPGTPINETSESGELPVSAIVFEMRSLGDRLEELDSSMARFAESTGGLLIRNNNDLDLGFHQLSLLPACTYLLGFTPAEDGKYHKIKVELKNSSHDFVQVRPGYFAPTPGSIEQPSPADKLDTLMKGTEEKTDLPATISEKLETAKSGGPQLTIQAHIDIQKLPFEQQRDRHVQKLTFVAALFDPHGNFVTGKQADMELALKPESFDRFSKTGINGVMQLEVPSGKYRLRIVVQEAVHGNISATSKELQIL